MPAGEQEGRAPEAVDPRSLLDRDAALALLTDELTAAWRSFDRPRPAEPILSAELRARFAEPLPEEPGEPAAALADATSALDASVSPSRPLYAAYVGSSGLEAGVLGGALGLAYDVNLASSAGAAELLEEQALRWLAELVGYPLRRGVFTSGGMTSNLTALLAARERALPGARERGIGDRRGAVYCSAEAHHSVVRAAEAIGLGSAAVRHVALDAERRMDARALADAVAGDVLADVVPVAVVATAGTTLTGAVDPIDALADVCAHHGTWLHVDGAYGLPGAAAPSVAARFAGLDRADSATVDAHKWLGVQKSCSALLCAHEDALRAAFGHEERYMLHDADVANPVDHTLEYSRPVRSLKLWTALRSYGAAAYRGWLEATIGHARELARLLDERDGWEVLHAPQLSTLCFRHVPRGFGDTDLDAHNLRLARAAQADGRVYLAPAEVDGRTCQRVCFTNARTRTEHVHDLVATLEHLAARPT